MTLHREEHYDSPTTHIRRARPDEANILSALALRSKAYWGYSPAFVEACRETLTLEPRYIAVSPVYLVQLPGAVAGFYGLSGAGEEASLDYLFVTPDAIGHGIGRFLWEHAVRTARRMGFEEIYIESDPHAEAFYLHMGAERVGERPSGVQPGRFLPYLRFRLV